MEKNVFGYCSFCKKTNILLLTKDRVMELGIEPNRSVCIQCQMKILKEIDSKNKSM